MVVEHTIAECEQTYVDGVGCQWWAFPNVKFEDRTNLTQAQCLSVIKTEIDAGRPVLIYGVEHWVVAYGYEGAGDTISLIKVLDPAGNFNNTPQKYEGEIRTLEEAMKYSKVKTLSRVQLTPISIYLVIWNSENLQPLLVLIIVMGYFLV